MLIRSIKHNQSQEKVSNESENLFFQLTLRGFNYGTKFRSVTEANRSFLALNVDVRLIYVANDFEKTQENVASNRTRHPPMLQITRKLNQALFLHKTLAQKLPQSGTLQAFYFDFMVICWFVAISMSREL